MKNKTLFILAYIVLVAACTQNSSTAQSTGPENRVGGRCEGCEAIYENPLDFHKLNWILELPGWKEDKNRLEINGIVYKKDGKTPAPGVTLYVYHTDQSGRYPTKGDEKGWARRHGYLRGWLKTNENGEYRIRTQRPASYPGTRIAAHIHCIVKEDGMNEYYIGDFLFEDDPFLKDEIGSDPNRKFPGGSGVLTLKLSGQTYLATRNIFLGQNVENYPLNNSTSRKSK